ncbi:MAG: response regulator transcription factor [Leptospirales bacterium]|nr:response regulator transcription factor [Leptospirales bacterium]
MNCGIVENDCEFAATLKARLLALPDISQVHVWNLAETFWRASWKDLDLCFVDLGLPGISGTELIGRLRAASAAFPCIVVSALNDDNSIVGAIEAGAAGYIWKGDLQNLAEVIQIVNDGGAIISPSIAVRLLHSLRKRSPSVPLPEILSNREIQIFQSIAEGRTPRQVSALFGTTEGTVRNQIKSIYKKLEVKNRVELMKSAARYDLLGEESSR